MNKLEELRARLQDIQMQCAAIRDKADAEKRDLNETESKEIDTLLNDFDVTEADIARRERIEAQTGKLDQPQARRTSPDPLPQNSAASADGLRNTTLRTTAERGRWGWNNFGDFAKAVRSAGVQHQVDSRLTNALTTYGSEGVGADGGFAVPPEYREQIMALVAGEDSLFSRTDNAPTVSNSVTVPTDETTAWGTSGVRVYSRAEAAAMTQSKPQLKDMTVRLNEIYAFVPVTDELLEDAPLLSRLLTTKAGEAIDFKINDYIVNGTGAGQPLGILNSGALVTVAAEGSQIASTIHAKNIAKMWARMPARARAGAVWLANQDVEPMLMELGFQVGGAAAADGKTGGMPLFVPPGGLSALPYATLMGKPIITTEACATLGTVGDLIFANLGGYFMPYKAGGVKSDVSMHLYFDQGVTSFRWTLRLGGQPWLSAPIARKNGSNTLSPFVALATRS